MKKILVEQCWECPWFNKDFTRCKVTKRGIEDVYMIDYDCPLEDETLEDESTNNDCHPLEGLPVDTLIEVTDAYMPRTCVRFFHGISEDGRITTSNDGQTNITKKGTSNWGLCPKILENLPNPWFGEPCKLPAWLKVKVWFRKGDNAETNTVNQWDWSHGIEGITDTADRDIIAYQILEQVPPKH